VIYSIVQPLSVEGETLTAAELRDLTGYLKLPHAAMVDVGSAARLLGVVFELADAQARETYARVEKIAETALIPTRTAEKQLRKLVKHGWLEHRGRRRPARGVRRRRTVTYRLTKKALTHRSPYAVWPRWLAGWKDLPPAAHLVYAVILSRHCLVETKEEDYGCLDGRRSISYSELQRCTGLARASISDALSRLSLPPALIEPSGTEYLGSQEPHWYDLIIPPGTQLHRQILNARRLPRKGSFFLGVDPEPEPSYP